MSVYLIILGICIFVTLLPVLVYLWIYIGNKDVFKFSWGLKGPRFFPFLGSTWLFIGKDVDCISSAELIVNKYKLPTGFWLGHSYYFGTTIISEIKVILNHSQCYDKGKVYDDIQCFFKNSMLLVPFELWKPRRKMFSRSFKPSILKNYTTVFYQKSCNLVEEINRIDDKEFDIFGFFNKFSFINFFVTSCGLLENYPGSAQFGKTIIELQEIFGKKILNPVIPNSLWFLFHPEGRKTANMIKSAKSFVFKVIEFKRKHQSNKDFIENNAALPLMDLMLNLEGIKMSDNDIFDEMFLFAAAATDTTGHTLSFCFTLLGMNQDIQEKLYEEIMSTVGYGEITHDNLSSLKYTEAVILETQRILPSIPIVIRQARDDIDTGVRIIPKGANILISIFHIQRDPMYWSDPLTFDPTRFVSENINKIKPYSYMPFSGGPRDCIGKTYAMMLMKTAVACVIRNFHITSKHKSVNEFVLRSCISMKTNHPLDCHFTPRTVDLNN